MRPTVRVVLLFVWSYIDVRLRAIVVSLLLLGVCSLERVIASHVLEV